MTEKELQQIYFRFYNKRISPQYRPSYIQMIPCIKRDDKGRPIKDEYGKNIRNGRFKLVKHY
jgi:hypothetical protein